MMKYLDTLVGPVGNPRLFISEYRVWGDFLCPLNHIRFIRVPVTVELVAMLSKTLAVKGSAGLIWKTAWTVIRTVIYFQMWEWKVWGLRSLELILVNHISIWFCMILYGIFFNDMLMGVPVHSTILRWCFPLQGFSQRPFWNYGVEGSCKCRNSELNLFGIHWIERRVAFSNSGDNIGETHPHLLLGAIVSHVVVLMRFSYHLTTKIIVLNDLRLFPYLYPK